MSAAATSPVRTARTFAGAVLLAACLGLAASSAGDPPAAETTSPPLTDQPDAGAGSEAADDAAAPVRWLYVVDGEAGTATDATITLSQVEDQALAFTDRPSRRSVHLPVQDLVADWADLGFEDDPPNASVAFETDGVEQVHVVELTNPVVEGDQVTFDYVHLADAPSVAEGEVVDELPGTIGPASLFIDAASDPVPGELTMTAITAEEFHEATDHGPPRCHLSNAWKLCDMVGKLRGDEPKLSWWAYAGYLGDTPNRSATATVEIGAGTQVLRGQASAEGSYFAFRWFDPPSVTPLGVGLDLDADHEIMEYSGDFHYQRNSYFETDWSMDDDPKP